MTLLPGLLVVLVAGCHAQYPAHTYPLPQQPVHYIPVVPYYQPHPLVYTAIVETSGTQTIHNSPRICTGCPRKTLFCVQKPINQVWKQLLEQEGIVFVKLRCRSGESQLKVRRSDLCLSQVNLRIQTKKLKILTWAIWSRYISIKGRYTNQ